MVNSLEYNNADSTNSENSQIVFHEKGIVDVTNFDAKMGESLGYLTGCTVFELSDGTILICEYENEDVIMETIDAASVIMFNDNINNFDPSHEKEVSVMTKSQDIRIEFESIEVKRRFANTFSALPTNG